MALAPSTRRRRARTRLFAPAALRPRPDHHRHREEDQVQAEDALLLRVGALGRGAGQRGQLGAHRGQVRAERLLELLEPQRQGARIGGAAGGVGGQHFVAEGEVGRLQPLQIQERALDPGQDEPVGTLGARIGEGTVEQGFRAREVGGDAGLRPVERLVFRLGDRRACRGSA